ncbi:MAG: hypothetical protein MRZ79_18440 [Bacteroidia bacterium]|nr:hypothetical protein [Bacteroidia bacterium]
MIGRVATTALITLLCTQVFAQKKMEGVFSYHNTSKGKYALYLPSSFKKGKTLHVVIAFHPFNSLKWNSDSWRDELALFAESNQILLVCPEMGSNWNEQNGNCLDYSKQLILHLLAKYDVKPNCIYALGMGMGANTALKMGIRHRNFVHGLLLISANPKILHLNPTEYAKCFNLPCYIIHGKNDHLQMKHYPLKKALNQAGACTKSNLIDGVGSNFQIKEGTSRLNSAFDWLHNYSCNRPEYVWNENRKIQIVRNVDSPSISINGMEITLSNMKACHAINRIKVYDQQGLLIEVRRQPMKQEVIILPDPGRYVIMLQSSIRNMHFNVETASK